MKKPDLILISNCISFFIKFKRFVYSLFSINRLGATRGVLEPIDEASIEPSKKDCLMDQEKYLRIHGTLYKVEATRSLLLNFFVIRY